MKAFQDQIAALQQEKTALEASLDEVRAKAAELSNQTVTLVSDHYSDSTPFLTFFQASVRKERDALLAEKGTWTKSAAPSTTEGASGESSTEEKSQVLRERDEALANWKVSRLRRDRAKLSIRPTESAGAGEPAEEPVEAELHADGEPWSPYQFLCYPLNLMF